MPPVGDFHDPFPFPPYAVQDDAVTRLRCFLRDRRHNIAVLESPTGTGKSHMLLTSVLSDLFTPVYPTSESSTSHANMEGQEGEHDNEAMDRKHTDACDSPHEQNKTRASVADPSGDDTPTLESMLRQRLYEDAVTRLKEERKARVRLLRRRMRMARKRKESFTHSAKLSGISSPSWKRGRDADARTGTGSGGDVDDADFLLEQHALDFLTEHVAEGQASLVGSFTSSSSASSSSSSDSDERSDGAQDDEGDEEAAVLSRLARLVPLRKPKAYIASRTHTQIRQLFDDLLQTDFVKYPIVPAHASRSHLQTTTTTTSSRDDKKDARQAPRALRAIHVAGRQQLCVNAALRKASGGRSEVLNDLCLEAMAHENSKAGRAARKAVNRQHATGTFTSGTGSMGDMEDMGKDKGCLYCATSKLKAFLAHLRPDQGDTDTPGSGGGVTSSSRPLSLEEMKALGEELKACPYLVSRLLVRGADVVCIPYGYLASEDLRNGLLGGVATNPMNEQEEEETQAAVEEAEAQPGIVHRHQKMRTETDEPHTLTSLKDLSSAPVSEASARRAPVSLSTMLYQRKQRAMAARAGQGGPHDAKAHERLSTQEVDTAQPPNFVGDVVALDEAHNVVDYCRSITTCDITCAELHLLRGLFTAYVARYETRMLTRNKQRVREMALFLGKLATCANPHATPGKRTHGWQSQAMAPTEAADGKKRPEHASNLSSSPSIAAPPAGAPAAAPVVLLKDFTSFLFEAGIDHIDVFPFLVFLVDSRLAVKLLGLVSFVLKQEAQAVAAYNESQQHKARLTQLDHARKRVKHAHDGGKGMLRTIVSDGNDTGDDDAAPDTPFHSLFGSIFSSRKEARVLVSAGGGGITTTMRGLAPWTTEEAVSATARAMQRFTALLQAFCISDTAEGNSEDATATATGSSNGGESRSLTNASNTRILLEVPPDLSDASSTTTSVICATTVIKVIQLEPGAHTLGPVLREAKGVILAGGTMQPLALTCGLLLPPPSPSPKSMTHAPASVAMPAKVSHGMSGVTLITEPHVVSPQAIRVWALPCGPSGRRLEFSHHALTSGPITGSFSSAEESVFAELATALLNFARVLPPAGVICFFTSYDMERRFHDFLVRRGLFDGLNAVKKIFREATSAAAAHGSASAATETVDHMLQAYKSWIYAEDTMDSKANAHTSAAASVPGQQQQQQQQPPQHQRRRGALLFAVMGGKLSEGINFADDLGRAVIVVGLPYANLSDVELRLFLRHVATTRVAPAGPTAPTSTTEDPISVSLIKREGDVCLPPLSREEWSLYTDMCMRTVNQCIGRCIRHIHDYASVILLDARYAERGDVRRRVSDWMQPSLNVAQSFGECFRGLRTFFEDKARDPSTSRLAPPP